MGCIPYRGPAPHNRIANIICAIQQCVHSWTMLATRKFFHENPLNEIQFIYFYKQHVIMVLPSNPQTFSNRKYSYYFVGPKFMILISDLFVIWMKFYKMTKRQSIFVLNTKGIAARPHWLNLINTINMKARVSLLTDWLLRMDKWPSDGSYLDYILSGSLDL